MKSRTWTRVLPAMGLVLVTASGCGLQAPGVASTVGGEAIATSRLQEVTSSFCDLIGIGVQSGQSQPIALSQQKQQLLGVLIEIELNRQFAEDRGVTPPAEVTGFLSSQLRAGFEQLDDADEEVLGDLVDDLSAGRAALAAVAAEETGAQVTPENLDQLQQAGLELRQQWQQDVEIDTDPLYAPGPDGAPGGGDTSVSAATSAFAQQAAAAAQGQDPGYAASLPASQRCGG